MHGVSPSQRQLIAGRVGLLFVVSVKNSSQTIDLSSICNTHVHFKLVLTIKICLRDNCKSLLTSCSLWGMSACPKLWRLPTSCSKMVWIWWWALQLVVLKYHCYIYLSVQVLLSDFTSRPLFVPFLSPLPRWWLGDRSCLQWHRVYKRVLLQGHLTSGWQY